MSPTLPPAFLAVLFGVFGAVFGSFFCVVAERWGTGVGIGGRSHCVCGEPIPGWLNVPLVSWLALRGRAACCGMRIPARTFWCEAAAAAGFASAPLLTGGDIAASVATCVYVAFAVVLGAIDARTKKVPLAHWLGYGGAAWAMAAVVAGLRGEWKALGVGAAISAGAVLLFEGAAIAFAMIRGVQGQGRGDTWVVAVTAGVPAVLSGNVWVGVAGVGAAYALATVAAAVAIFSDPSARQAYRERSHLKVIGAWAGALAGADLALSMWVGAVDWPMVVSAGVAGGFIGMLLSAMGTLSREHLAVKLPLVPFLVAGPWVVWVVTAV